MRFEPFGREGISSFLTSDLTQSTAWRFVTGSGLGWMLMAFGLVVGIGVGNGIGSADNTASVESNNVLASGETPASHDGIAVASLSDVMAINEAEDNADAAAGGSVVDHDVHEAGEVVAKYAAVSVDTLPIHQSVGEPQVLDSLTIVTRGEIGLGESLGSSLRRQGVSPGTVHLIATEMRQVFDFRRSRPGDQYRLGQDSDGRVLDFRYAQGPEESFYLSWQGSRYVVRKETAELRPQIAKIAGIVDSSFYGAILALGEQSSLASEFSRILAWDIDFSRNVHPGDEFQILYERLYRRNDDGEDVYVRPGRVLAGRYDGNVGRHTVVYFEDAKGVGGYFRPDGSSVARSFLVAPLEFSRISSRFTRARRHPILNVTRPHPGIDYAAPKGTPIWAVAEGVVEYRARAGASGNLIRIRHIDGYTSHYAHLASFAKDLAVGDRVEQKQIIGFVGSTGLSTGPHVCFRVKRHGHYVDPMRISSPAGLPVDADKLIVFNNVRDRLLADLGPGPLNVADEAL